MLHEDEPQVANTPIQFAKWNTTAGASDVDPMTPQEHDLSTQPTIPAHDAAPEGFAPAPSTNDVLIARQGTLGRILLNRPRTINALTTDMVEAVSRALSDWRDDDTITAVTIEGAGDRGLCAGGDVKGVRQAFIDGAPDTAFAFFEREYRMNALIADYPKLIVSYQDGIVMGGGVGISAYTGLRVATERTRMAMPETIIGFFPDVGALYLLSRAPGGLGAYVALTGESITGPDAVHLGLSDVVIDGDAWPQMLECLAAGGSRRDAVGGLSTHVKGALNTAPLVHEQAWIDECFGTTPNYRPAAEVLDRLRRCDAPVARQVAEALAARSPLSVVATLEALRRAATMTSVHEVLAQDLRLARGLVEHGDFVEGVRAQLVDKDRSPQWSQDGLADMTDDEVARLFG